jgi:hypothetical protein
MRNSFPDLSGRQIRCTSFGQALYSLPGGKLNPPDTSRWFKIFYKGLDNQISFLMPILSSLRTRLPSVWLILPMMLTPGIFIPSWSGPAFSQSA